MFRKYPVNQRHITVTEILLDTHYYRSHDIFLQVARPWCFKYNKEIQKIQRPTLNLMFQLDMKQYPTNAKETELWPGYGTYFCYAVVT